MPATREILSTEELQKPEREFLNEAHNTSERAWQKSLAEAIRDLPTLLERMHLQPADFSNRQVAAGDFPVLVPESYLRRMRPGDAADPLLLQILPSASELHSPAEFVKDPVQDEASRSAPGMLHKYQGRALLMAHGSCAVHCRYCFRRHFPYDREPHSREAWQPAFEAIRQDPSLHEILLSGGDPLILSNRRLFQFFQTLEEIPHVRRLRIHSRLPIVLPNRITGELIDRLRSSRLRVVFVIHSNHARELTGDCAQAIEKLVDAGLMVLNQAVLLRGVNDTVPSLVELCERCVDLGVLPYYLHQLDRVQGAAHFEVPVATGRELMRELRRQLPGYALPKYVWEEPGGTSKMPLE